MSELRVVKPLTALLSFSLLLPLGLSGCPDPEARYEAFEDHSQEERGRGTPDFSVPDASSEPFDPMTLSGTYMLSLGTALDATKPLIFQAIAEVREAGAGHTIELQLKGIRSWCEEERCKPEDAEFREVLDGEIPSPGAVPLNEDGEFEMDFGAITAPGGANNISGSEIQVSLKLFGRVASDGTLCGQFEGDLVTPFPFPLKREENNFGTVRSEGPYNNISPVSTCF